MTDIFISRAGKAIYFGDKRYRIHKCFDRTGKECASMFEAVVFIYERDGVWYCEPMSAYQDIVRN